MSDYIELEYKYRADNVKLTDFIELIKSLNPSKRMNTSSWDLYFTTKSLDAFQRFRHSETPELTKKVKTQNGNNWKRIEVDLPLDPERVTEDIITKYLELDDYHFNFKIYKTCTIFWLEDVNYVFYITYDHNMNENGRFIEVEINKNKVKTMEDPIEILNKAEKELNKIGITFQNRLKKSLFEMFVKSIDK